MAWPQPCFLPCSLLRVRATWWNVGFFRNIVVTLDTSAGVARRAQNAATSRGRCVCRLQDWTAVGTELWAIPIPGVGKYGVFNRFSTDPTTALLVLWGERGVVQLVDTKLPKPKLCAQRGRPHPTHASHQTVRTQLCHMGGGGGREDAPSKTTFLLRRPIPCSAPWNQAQCAIRCPQGREAAGHAPTRLASELQTPHKVPLFPHREQNSTSSIRRQLRKRA